MLVVHPGALAGTKHRPQIFPLNGYEIQLRKENKLFANKGFS
jgi:hypothetical protein